MATDIARDLVQMDNGRYAVIRNGRKAYITEDRLKDHELEGLSIRLKHEAENAPPKQKHRLQMAASRVSTIMALRRIERWNLPEKPSTLSNHDNG